MLRSVPRRMFCLLSAAPAVCLVLMAFTAHPGFAQAVAESDAAVATPSRPTMPVLEDISELTVGRQFPARDTLNPGKDDNEDAWECLTGLKWQPSQFTVSLEEGNAQQRFDRLVRFPSPSPLGDDVNDLVAMEWHVAYGDDGQPIKAPALVVVHESGSGMTVGRMLSKGLRAHGLHTFMLQMPGYGVRKSRGNEDVTRLLPSLKQAISDVRRARDAVAALPFVDNDMIGVQGTSLGGFVTATVGGIDQGYDRVFILLAGGNLNEVIFQGARDAASVRQRLEEAGATREMIMEYTRQIEPLRLAHRIRPEVTWLYSGKFDDVVPPLVRTPWRPRLTCPPSITLKCRWITIRVCC